MPRPKSAEPRLVRQQQRQAQYRAKLLEIGRPEVSAVDIAVAEAVSMASRQLAAGLKSGKIQQTDPRRHLLQRVVAAATNILVGYGLSREHVEAQIAHRLHAPRKHRPPPVTS